MSRLCEKMSYLLVSDKPILLLHSRQQEVKFFLAQTFLRSSCDREVLYMGRNIIQGVVGRLELKIIRKKIERKTS